MTSYLNLNRRSQIERIVEQGGDWLHGGQVEETIQEWYETNLDVDTIEDYIDAKCWDARSAFLLAANGCTPAEAAMRDEDGFTLGERFSNNDISLSQILYITEKNSR
jgi:hypothetical protein